MPRVPQRAASDCQAALAVWLHGNTCGHTTRLLDGRAQVGQRDFTPSSATTADAGNAFKADLDSAEKEYTNGVVAPNRVVTITGPLTGEVMRLPDVDSGYPIAYQGPVTPVAEGKLQEQQGEPQWFDRGEKGQPDFLEWKRKVGDPEPLPRAAASALLPAVCFPPCLLVATGAYP